MSFKTLPGRKAGSTLVSSNSSTRSPRSYSPGGYLVGPSHDDGGIEAIVDDEEPIEVEGGEFVMREHLNASTGPGTEVLEIG